MRNDKAIVFVVDDGYVDYLLLALRDVYQASGGICPVYVIAHEIKIGSLRKIMKIAEVYKIPLEIVHIDKKWQKHVDSEVVKSRRTHVTATSYAKLLLGELLPKEVKFAYYFDIDILVMRSFPDLMAIEPKKTLAAVDHLHPAECERLTGESGRYFNTGVFVANLDRWRETKVQDTSLGIVDSRAEDLLNLDQDALFLALQDDWEELPLIYNFFLMRFNPYVENTGDLDWNPQKITPVIVHFAGPWKPWNGHQRANTYRIWRDRRKNL